MVDVSIQKLVSTSIFPNPAINQIVLSGENSELKNFQIYNIFGENSSNLISIIERFKNKLVIDISKLNSGIYIFKTKNTASKIYKR